MYFVCCILLQLKKKYIVLCNSNTVSIILRVKYILLLKYSSRRSCWTLA